MSELHDALKVLRPKDFPSEVPLDDLDAFMKDVFRKAELVINSVPPPAGGDDFNSSSRSRKDINGATKATEVTPSPARPPPPHPTYEELQKSWGKSMKFSEKDNPGNVAVYKMAGKDRHGAWFARRSVHEGLGFSKWKRAMQREFAESLAVQGGPGAGAVRGIGSDRRLERRDVDGVGRMEVYQLSAAFPGPVTPREFITMLLTTDKYHSDDVTQTTHQQPRHYMVVSIPVTHPDAPPRTDLVRGMYESVELIREVPLSKRKVGRSATDLDAAGKAEDPQRTASRKRGSTIGFAESRGPDAKGERLDRHEEGHDDDPDTNPVEWIMITRSDPGGGIPKFLVERNTPASIVADTNKFLDWACSQDHIPHEDDDRDLQDAAQAEEKENNYSAASANGHLAGLDPPDKRTAAEPAVNNTPEQHPGIIASAAAAVENGAYSFAPGTVQALESSAAQYAPAVAPYLAHADPKPMTDDDGDDSTDTSSLGSFESAAQWHTAEDSGPTSRFRDSTDSVSMMSTDSPNPNKSQTKFDKEMAKIEARRRRLNDKLNKAKEKQDAELEKGREKEQREAEKAQTKVEKELQKQEEKNKKEIEKLQQKQEKEARKLREKQLKESEKSNLNKTQRERDEAKSRAEVAEKEAQLLREQVADLQRENTLLVQRLGKMDNGPEILRKLKDDAKRERKRAVSGASSIRSGSSGKKSSETVPQVEKDKELLDPRV